MDFWRTMYVLKKDVGATAVDDAGTARFPDDTVLPAGVEFEIVKDRHDWPPRTEAYYTIESRGSLYNVRAAELDHAMEKVA